MFVRHGPHATVQERARTMTALGIALGFLVGLSLGLLGGGGSILTVPILAYVVGFDPKPAIAMSLVVVGGTSTIGAVGHARARHVRLPVALLFGLVSMGGSYASARLAAYVPGVVQMTIFAIVMLMAAGFMFAGRRDLGGTDGPVHYDAKDLALIAVVGLGVGALTGLVGVGGGFLFVPALVLLGHLPMKDAIGTSLVVIAMNCVAGFSGYLGQVTIPWGFLIAFTAVAGVGSLVGAAVTTRVSHQALRRTFSLFLILMGLAILYKNRRVFLGY